MPQTLSYRNHSQNRNPHRFRQSLPVSRNQLCCYRILLLLALMLTSISTLAPTIITTSPTTNQIERPQKRKTKFNILARSNKPSRENLVTETLDNNTPDNGANNGATARTPQASPRYQTAGPSFRASHVSFEEPGRLSTNSVRSGPRGFVEDSTTPNTSPGTRLSESSRSDGSSGGGNNHVGPKNGGQSTNSPFFRLPRLKKSRVSLFPLPVKIPPPDGSPSDASRMSPTTKSQASSARHSPLSKPAPLSATQLSQTDSNQDYLQPLPSPSRSSVALTSGVGLSRNDSIASARSTKSSPAPKPVPRSGRGRSSTMGSLADIQDDPQQTSSPPPVPSGRTSTSTSGRKSFGDLFGLSHRLRHDSEPPLPRNGSPNFGGPGTPVSAPSKSNSFSLARELTSYPEREEGDTSATYLSRLEGAVHRGAIATILSQSSEDFFRTTLRRYMRGFAFFGDPMDMAIRKLLMEAELPKETQQIDRVIQAFADRYHECNPGIFASTGTFLPPRTLSCDTRY